MISVEPRILYSRFQIAIDVKKDLIRQQIDVEIQCFHVNNQ